MSVPLLSADALARDLAVRDLTDPAQGLHAIQLVIDDIVGALGALGALGADVDVRIVRAHPIVSLDDNYDRLGFSADAVTRDARYTRYVSETCVLRTHTSAMVPAALRGLAGERPDDALVACPGIVYRRDVIDRLHSGTPHQLDLWRVRRVERGPTAERDLVAMIDAVVAAALPGRRWRTVPAEHPYTTGGRQIDVLDDESGEWIEIGECGLAGASVLAGAGLAGWDGLAMGLGLDRIVMLRKGIADIRLLRSEDPRVGSQLLDLEPYRPVSNRPPVQRDLSLAVPADVDAELLGDRVREALGDHAAYVEDLMVLDETPAPQVPRAAAARLGLQPHQKNVLLRVVLRPVDHTLTNAEANVLRDRIYAALHEGAAHQWAAG